MTFKEAVENLKLKFTSGNDIEIERATILRKEWDVIYPVLVKKLFDDKLKEAIDKVCEDLKLIPDEELKKEIESYNEGWEYE